MSLDGYCHKRGLQETIHLVTIELIKKCNYRVSMLGKPANIKYWLFCHSHHNPPEGYWWCPCTQLHLIHLPSSHTVYLLPLLHSRILRLIPATLPRHVSSTWGSPFMLVYHGPLERTFPYSCVLLSCCTCYRLAHGRFLFLIFFSFLVFFSLDHRVAMQCIDRCLVVEAREKLPIGVTDL